MKIQNWILVLGWMGTAAMAQPLELAEVHAPEVVAVPPIDAVREMCRTATGEIRHYGRKLYRGEVRKAYLASRDEGLSWKLHLASSNDAGAMVQSPWSGAWLSIVIGANQGNFLVRSARGPGDPHPALAPLGWKSQELRQLFPLRSRKRWVAALSDVRCPGTECYHAAVAYSDDDGLTWTWKAIPPVADVPRLGPGDKRPHWYNTGCEPSCVELGDGTLLLAVRTSGPHHAFYTSKDGGETWSAGKMNPAFWAANTMPYLFRLKDGRILFIWNNTALLPTRELAEYPEIGAGERSGQWETVFTNRDVLHAAISEDDGRTWIGFREIALTETRNQPDFRELGNAPDQSHDKSVHQTQALELPGGKILLSYGQNRAARRMCLFDVKWLYETGRHEDFRTGLGNVSTHLYVRSLSGGWRGWAGHCAWNRVPGAVLRRDPDTDTPPPGAARSVREVLQLCRIPDPRLVSNRQGVVWNFPAAQRGKVTLVCRRAGRGFRLTLADHWMNPCDETGPRLSALSVPVEDILSPDAWHTFTVTWDRASGTACLACDGKALPPVPFSCASPAGVSYLHLQTLAEDGDPLGTYFRSFDMTR